MSTQPLQTTPNGGYVSNEVIALQLRHLETTLRTMGEGLTTELQLLRAEAVRRDVYDEQRRVDRAELDKTRAELANVKDELKEARQRKWAVWLALIGAGVALAKDVLTPLMQAGG